MADLRWIDTVFTGNLTDSLLILNGFKATCALNRPSRCFLWDMVEKLLSFSWRFRALRPDGPFCQSE